MKKKILSFLIFLAFSISAFGQRNIESLKGLKYAYVYKRVYKNERIDIYGLSSFLKSELLKKGYLVLDDDKIEWPAEAKYNPCLIGHWYPTHISKNKAGYVIKSCNDEVIYENYSAPLIYTNDYGDNYYRAMKKALEPIYSFNYNYDEKLTPIIVYPEVEKSNETEESLKHYFSTNKIDIIEGIYKSYQSDVLGFYKFAIKKYNGSYKAIILESGYKAWKNGEVKAYFEPSAMGNFYSVKWFLENKSSVETFANLENSAILSVEFKNDGTGGKRQDKFIKIFPSVESLGASKSQEVKATGSGFLISVQGIVATNAHVIEDAKKISISISNEMGNFKYKARILLSDMQNDVAILQIDDEKFKRLSVIPYSLKNEADIGEKVFTIGYPLNNIMGNNYKLSDGIISAKTGIEDDVRYYQISVPLQPGNSGGPLFDSDGNVIGITTAKLNSRAAGTQVENVNYAIKVSYLLTLYNMLPNNIPLQSNSKLSTMELKEQVKLLKNFVCLIEVE